MDGSICSPWDEGRGIDQPPCLGYRLFFFVLFSCVAGFMAGIIVSSGDGIPAWQFLLVGLANSLTIVEVSMAVEYLQVRVGDYKDTEYPRKFKFVVVFSLSFLALTIFLQYLAVELLRPSFI